VAAKKGSIAEHSLKFNGPQSYFVIKHEEGQFSGNITNVRISGKLYINKYKKPIKWRFDPSGQSCEIHKGDPTRLKVPATPLSGRLRPKIRGRRGLTVTVTMDDVTVTVTTGDGTRHRGMGDLTATVTNGDGTDVTAYNDNVTYND
jgi:hypothetical protein